MRCYKCKHAYAPEGAYMLHCSIHGRPCDTDWWECRDFELSMFEWLLVLVPAHRLKTRLTEASTADKMKHKRNKGGD